MSLFSFLRYHYSPSLAPAAPTLTVSIFLSLFTVKSKRLKRIVWGVDSVPIPLREGILNGCSDNRQEIDKTCGYRKRTGRTGR